MTDPRPRLAPLLVLALVVALVALPAAALGQPSPSPSPSPSGSTTPSATPTPSPSSQPSSTPSPSPSPSAAGDVNVSMGTSVLMGQVGDVVRYTVVAQADRATDDMVVTVQVPAELDVASVPLDDDAEAITAGAHGSAEDIVWVLDRVGPGETVELEWFATVVQAGDLQATAVVEARSSAGQARDTNETFLAAAPAVATAGRAAPDQVKGKVIRRAVAVPAAPGSVLPVTGWSPAGMLWLAFACMTLGAALWVVGLTRPSLRRSAALFVLVGLMAACTPASDESAAPEPAPSQAAPAETETEPETETKDRVLGKRIFNEDPEATEVADTGSAPAEGPVTIFENVITTVPPELEVVVQDDRASDNTMSMAWTEPAREVGQATSGLIYTAGQPSALTVGLSWDADGLSSGVTLENTSGAALKVEGEIILEVTGAGGASSTLTSGPLDVTLAPGGHLQVIYRYLLPSGEYTVTSSFHH